MSKETEQSKQVPQKPLILEMRDAKLELVNSINSSINQRNLPAYILRGIVEEILNSLKDMERQELELTEKQYMQAVKESQE